VKKIYLVLTKSPTLISKAIQKATNDEFTHSSISFSDTIQPMYSFGRKFAYLNLPAGLKEEPLDKGFYKHYKDVYLGVYSLEVSDEAFERTKNYVEKLFANRLWWRYNLIGLALARREIPTKRKHKMFCSEFVANCLKVSGEVQLDKPSSLYRPNDFAKLEGVKCIYKGSLREAKGHKFADVEWKNK